MQSHAHNQLKHHIQQPLFKLTTSSAPSPQTSSSYFASPIKSVSHGHQLNIRPVNSPSSNYFRPNTPRQKERETEKVEKERAQSAERIQTLHTRLHQEAEKIRKWKTSTEIEIKEKEKKLQEAVQTIDSQRKSIIELQFQNESLSTRLQEELANREEVEHKITSTRDMCNALKDHVAKVEENLQRGESDRDELRFEEKKRLEQFQELVVKFQDLEIQHTAKYNEIKVTLEERIKDHKQYVLESSEKMDKAESQICLLENEKNAKESHIATMEAVLENSKEELTFLEHQLESFQDKVKKQESVITSQQVQIQNTEEMLRLNEEECKRKEDERKAIQSQLEDSQQLNQALKDSVLEMKKEQRLVLDELETQLSSLIEEKQKLEESLQDLNAANATATEKMKGLQVELETVTREKEKVNTLNSHILKEKGELEKACADLQTNLAKELERTTSKAEIIRQSKENLAQLQEKNSSMRNSLDQAHNEREELEEKIRLLTLASEEKQRTISDLEGKLYNANYNQKYLSENVQDLQEKISEERKEKDELQKSIADLKASERKLKEKISSLEENASVLEKKLMSSSEDRKGSEKVIERLQEEHQNLREQYDKMKEDIMMQDEERTLILEKERGNTQNLKDDLKERTKQIESLEAKIKSLQEQLAAKTKQTKEVQQENKILKSKVTTQTKNADKSENQKTKLSNELSACKEQIKDLTHKLKQSNKEEEAARNHSANVNAKMEALKEELSMKSKELEKREEEVKRFKEETEEAMQEKESTQQKCENQMNELCATLEKYKLENEKIVAQKERELELLRANAERESQDQHSKQLREANEQIDRLEKEVRRLRVMQQKDDQRSQIEISETVALLKKQLEEKNEDIKLLQGKIEKQDKPSKTARESFSEKKLATPKVITPQPPAVVPETPKQPRSILKQKEVSQKKRRVVFAGSDELHLSSSEEEENELSLTKIGTKGSKSDTKETSDKENKKTTPRANVRFSPKPSPWKNEPSGESKSPFTEVQKLKQIPRGKPIAQQKQKKMKIQSEVTEEMAKFKELFPDMSSPDSLYDKSPGKGCGLRQTTRPPFKSKITKIKPISRKKDNQESTSWFDSDSLFGFGMEGE